MKFPKPKEYYEFIYQTYRKKDRNSCHQYRINGKVVSEEVYYDSRSELYQKPGSYIVACTTTTINKDTERTTLTLLVRK